MGRLEKLKRQIILEANKRILNESNAGPLDATPLNFSVEDFQPVVDDLNNVIVNAVKKHVVDKSFTPYKLKLQHKNIPQQPTSGPDSYDEFTLIASNYWNNVAFYDPMFNTDKWGVRTSSDEYGSNADRNAGTFWLTDSYRKDDNKHFVSGFKMPGGKAAKNTLRKSLKLLFGEQRGWMLPTDEAKDNLALFLIMVALKRLNSNTNEDNYNKLKVNPGGVFNQNSIDLYREIRSGIEPVVDKFISDMKSKIDNGYTQVWNGLTSQATR